ncbi:MAG: LCP family protein [Actinomycetota bacterium]
MNNTTKSEANGDDFELQLAIRLRAATDGLEPSHLAAVEVTTGRPSRVPVRAGAIGLVAAAAVGLIVLASARGPGTDVAIPGPESPGTPSLSPQDTSPPGTPAPEETFPPVDPTTKNILVVGTDNHSCTDDTALVDGLGDRSALGERSDTIMIVRLDPANGTAAMLSFPRDLWLPIAGGRMGRINSAFTSDDPGRLIDTIFDNFAIPIDHYVQIDLCAFKRIVDAVGGVDVPFTTAVRDRNTGFQADAGCVNLDGDQALAYVRARHLEFLESGVWQQDPTSDLGRITRQQDFVRRTIAAASQAGVSDVAVARALIDSIQNDIVVDSQLTISDMLGFGRFIVGLDSSAIAGYQIETAPRVIAGNSVLTPVLDTPTMVAVLHEFTGATTHTELNTDTAPASTGGVTSVVPGVDTTAVVPSADLVC